MGLIIDNRVFESFPGLAIGVIHASGIDNSGSSAEIYARLQQEMARICSSMTFDDLVKEPRFESWREAFRSFKAKPKKYRSSVENLYRMVLEDVELRSINKLVDLYNLFSLKGVMPLGGDDLSKVNGDIQLTIAEGDEKFIALNSEEITSPKAGEVIYRDDEEVLCRRWNWRECNKSKMTEETTEVLLVVEGLPPVSATEVNQLVDELAREIATSCGGSIQVATLTEADRAYTFEEAA